MAQGPQTEERPGERPPERAPFDAEAIGRRISQGSLGRALLIALPLFVVILAGWGTAQVVSGLCLPAIVALAPALVLAAIFRRYNGAGDRRFGVVAAYLALLVCLEVDALSAWNLLHTQAPIDLGLELPTVQELPRLLALFGEYCGFIQPLQYGLVAGTTFLLASRRRGTSSDQRGAWDHLPRQALITIGVLALLLFWVFMPVLTDPKSAQQRTVLRPTEAVLGDPAPSWWDWWPPEALSYNGEHTVGARIVRSEDSLVLWSTPDRKGRSNTTVSLVKKDARRDPWQTASIRSTTLLGPGDYLCVAYCSSDSLLAVGGRNGNVTFCSLDGGNAPRNVSLSSAVTSLAFDGEGKSLAMGQRDGDVTLWDMRADRLKRSFRAHDSPVSALAFSDDGALLFSAGAWRDVVRAWDKLGKETFSFRPPTSRITSLALSPSGQTLAVAGGSFHQGAIYLLDAQTGAERRRLAVADNVVSSVGFAASGQVLAGTRMPITLPFWHGGGRVHCWDATTGEELPPTP